MLITSRSELIHYFEMNGVVVIKPFHQVYRGKIIRSELLLNMLGLFNDMESLKPPYVIEKCHCLIRNKCVDNNRWSCSRFSIVNMS